MSSCYFKGPDNASHTNLYTAVSKTERPLSREHGEKVPEGDL